jgi:hypothetical protein
MLQVPAELQVLCEVLFPPTLQFPWDKQLLCVV